MLSVPAVPLAAARAAADAAAVAGRATSDSLRCAGIDAITHTLLYASFIFLPCRICPRLPPIRWRYESGGLRCQRLSLPLLLLLLLPLHPKLTHQPFRNLEANL